MDLTYFFLYKGLVDDSKFMLQRCRFSVSLVHKEANTCEDALANVGTNQIRELVVLRDSLIELNNVLIADMIELDSQKI